MHRGSFRSLYLAAALAVLPSTVLHAAIDDSEVPVWKGREDAAPEWREAPAPEVRYPRDRDLVPVRGVTGLDVEVFVDGRQLFRGTDGVVRYLLLFRSPSGAESVFYEGMRCGARQWRRYAYGSQGRMRAALSDWQPLGQGRQAGLHRLLYEAVFCPAGVLPPDAGEMRRRLRSLAATVNDLTDE